METDARFWRPEYKEAVATNVPLPELPPKDEVTFFRR